MNHAISHCRGEGCMLRDTCMHYQAHLEYQADEHLKASIAVPYNDESECLLNGSFCIFVSSLSCSNGLIGLYQITKTIKVPRMSLSHLENTLGLGVFNTRSDDTAHKQHRHQ